MWRLFVLFFVMITAEVIHPDDDGHYRIVKNLDADTLNFTILGDFGGFPKPFYTTPIQINAAKLLESVSDKINSEFNLAIGDNFYFWGVESINDNRWLKSFEQVYQGTKLQKVPCVVLN